MLMESERWHFTSAALIKKKRRPRSISLFGIGRHKQPEGREKCFYDSFPFVIDFCVYVFYGSSPPDDDAKCEPPFLLSSDSDLFPA
jgi:hypothetical protein